MRFTKKLYALVSSVAVATSAQVGAQAPAPAGGNDEQLREALRKALDGQAPSTTPATANPVVPAPTIPTPTTPLLMPVATSSVPTMAWSNSTNVINVSLTLDEAIRLALEHNLDLQVARYVPIIADYDRRALYGAYDPTFSAGIRRINNLREAGGLNLNTGNTTPGTRSRTYAGDLGLNGLLPSGMTYEFSHTSQRNQVTTPREIGTNSFGDPVFFKQTDTTWDSAAALTATQPLLRDFWIDDTRLSIKLGRRAVTRSQLDLERQIMLVVNTVEQTYYDVIALRELVRVGEADVAVKKQFFDEQRRRVEVGTLAPLEEKLAQSALAASEIALIRARNDAATGEALLKGLVRDNFLSQLNTRLALTDRLLPVPATFDLQDSVKYSLEMRPDLQSMRVMLDQLEVQLKYDKNQLFPRLDLSGTLGYNGLDKNLGGSLEDIADRNFEQSSIGLALSFPLWSQRERNALKSTKAALAQSVVMVKQLEETIIQEVELQGRLIATYWQTIPMTREQTAAAQAALEAEQKKLAAGKSTSFNVLELASALTSAQANEITTLRDYNKALAELAFRKGSTLERWRIDRPARPTTPPSRTTDK
jgi:outer membrane protein TolC